jgi:hypothetical protein
MSLRKRLKSIGSKVQEKAKDVGRQVQSVAAKVVVPVTAGLSAVGTFIGGPALGAAFALPGTAIARGVGATAARKEGLKGMDARTEGRELAQRTLKYGMLGMTAGMAGAGIAGMAGLGGGGLLGGLTGGVGNIFGIGGGGGAAPGGWESGGLLDTLYNQGPNVSGTAFEAAGTPGFDWGSLVTKGAALGQTYLTRPKGSVPATAAQQGGGGGFGEILNNLMSTAPGSGAVDLPVVGQVPMGVILIGGAIALWAVAK